MAAMPMKPLKSASAAASVFPWYDHWAARAPDDPAMVTPTGHVSYGDLAQRIAQEQSRLTDEGFRAGDRLLHADHPGTVKWLATLVGALNLRLQVILPDQDWPQEQTPVHTARLLERARRDGDDADRPGGVWLFTSGTTSTPKPRLRSLALLHSDVTRVQARLPALLRERRPAGLCLLPLSHGFGLINALLLVHAIGGTVLVEDIDNPDSIARLLRKHPVQILYSWPAHLEALTDRQLWQQTAAPLAWCVSSSLRLSPDVGRQFAAVTGCSVRQQYGATETGPLSMDSDDPPCPATSCMGLPFAGVEFRVMGSSKQALPADREGELAVRLNHLSLDPSELTVDGYWSTGDHGYRDRAGRIHVLGRLTPFTDERQLASKEGD